MKKHVVTLLLAGVVRLTAQNAEPHFEVASVKRSAPNAPYAASGFQPGGRFVGRNMTVQRLLLLAFRDENGNELRLEQIVGGPSWISSTLFDIDARVAGPATAERIVDPQAAAILRSLLADRFNLQVHRDQRELPFYALMIDKADGSLGPNMKPSTIDCDAMAREREAARPANRVPAIPASTQAVNKVRYTAHPAQYYSESRTYDLGEALLASPRPPRSSVSEFEPPPQR
jgi:uncharacterized protein (TIGR03435 family)